MAIDISDAPPPTDTRTPVLQVRDLGVDFYVDGTWYPAATGINYDVRPGEVLAIVGESGSGKTQSLDGPHGPAPAERSGPRLGRDRGPRAHRDAAAQAAPDPRQGDRDDLPGADDRAEPGLHHRLPDHRDAADALRDGSGGRPRACARAAAPRRDPEPRDPDRRVPAPAVRRSAAARDDRPGAGVRPEAAHRRRADDGPRRHGPGRDPQAHARPALPHRLGHRPDHPRHGRRRRHGRHDDRDEGRQGRRAG